MSIGIAQISPDFFDGAILNAFQARSSCMLLRFAASGGSGFSVQVFSDGNPRSATSQATLPGKDVGAAIGLRIAVLLGRREIHSAEAYRVLPRCFIVYTRDAKVDKRDFSLRVHYDILMLDIPVDHGRRLTMKIGKYVAKLKDDGDDLFLLLQLVFGGISVKRRSLDILAHNAQHPVVLVFRGEPGKAGMTEIFLKSIPSVVREISLLSV